MKNRSLFFNKFHASFILFIFFLGTFSGISAPLAELIREGNGEIRGGALSSSEWPEEFSLPHTSGSKGVYRLPEKFYPPLTPEVLDTWNADHFTQLAGRAPGPLPDYWHLMVHGLEIEEIMGCCGQDVRGFPIAFDQFIAKHFNKDAPLGSDFIPYYPYYALNYKTGFSASVISHNLTATFGKCGFVLGVPPENLMSTAREDCHSPIDAYYYSMGPLHSKAPWPNFGEFMLPHATRRYPVLALNTLMPSEPLSPKKPSRPIKQTPYTLDKEGYIIEALEMEWLEGKSPQEVARLENMIKSRPDIVDKAIKKATENTSADPVSMYDTVSGRQATQRSWYNEFYASAHRQQPGADASVVTIKGIFLRTGRDTLEAYKKRPEVQQLLRIAEAFDLPVVAIYDPMDYSTAI